MIKRVKWARKTIKMLPFLIAQRNAYVEAIDAIGRVIDENKDNPLSFEIAARAKPYLDAALEASNKIGEIERA
jgi:hypothetical protein